MITRVQEVLLSLRNRLEIEVDWSIYGIGHQANTLPFSALHLDFLFPHDRVHCKGSYSIVVAVPTKSRLAFSSPALLGCTLVSLASGRLAGNCAPGGKSRVGASELLGSIVRCFIVCMYVLDEI